MALARGSAEGGSARRSFPLLRWAAFALYLLLFAAAIGLMAVLVQDYTSRTRGVQPRTSPQILGANVALDQYNSPPELDRALALVRSAGITMVRQEFPWREIEAARGQFDWSRWDKIVDATEGANLQVVAVLDTSPAWAQRDYEQALPGAPPDNFQQFANFAAAFALRYHSRIHYYEIWEGENIHPDWGRRNAEPAEYARFLRLAAEAIRSQDSQAKIILGGLGMNLETQRPHPDYSEVLYLRGLYDAGAQKDFDIVAAKPHGMWTGPEDRRVSPDVLNFSRVILLHEEMEAHGDGRKPVWAVEMGWNALPSGWEGPPSPWGSDSELVQSDRLVRGLARARDEWGWMGALFPQLLMPHAAPTDPRWGFSLLTSDFQPRPLYNALATFATHPPPPLPPASAPILSLALLALVGLAAAWRGVRVAPMAELSSAWALLRAGFQSLPEAVQFAAIGLTAGAFFVSPSTPLNFVLLALLVPLFALRLDLGLVLLTFSIPFFLYPKTLFGNFQVSAVEVLTLVGCAAWLWRTVLTPARLPLASEGEASIPLLHVRGPGGVRSALWEVARSLSRFNPLDWAVLALVLLGLISTRVAANSGVATRELRVIVVEPALFYALLRAGNLSLNQLRRLVDGLLLAGALISLIGLVQFATGDVIAADGVSRVRGVWGSPNNAALFLGRLLPLALALALFIRDARGRALYGALAGLLAITLYLTYSRGALFLGVPASVVFVGLVAFRQGTTRVRIPRAAVAAGLLLLVIAGAALLSSARVQSLFQEGTGTGFFRVAVWTSALQMIRDHPLFGVGLDNFLYEYPKYMLPEAWREPNLSHPHNIVLDFWVRLGVFGVVALVWMEFQFFRRAWRAARRDGNVLPRALAIGFMGAMVDVLAHGMIDAAYFVVDLAFVFMLCLGAAAALDSFKDST